MNTLDSLTSSSLNIDEILDKIPESNILNTRRDEQSILLPNVILPSISRQKTFIIDNSHILNTKSKLDILRISMLDNPNMIMEKSGSKEVSINLDGCSLDTILHIYNIVKKRLDLLNKPVVQD